MNLFFIGDVVGKPGRRALFHLLPDLVRELSLDMVIANGENAAGGIGITPETADEMLSTGVHVVTTGNHIWKKREIYEYMKSTDRVLRPANYCCENPGIGWTVIKGRNDVPVGVMNLEGRVFLKEADSPFEIAESLIPQIKERTKVLLVDFHAEATSEKVAMGWFLAGKASAVVGTHTHVQTADERVLPGGTAYITDVGMTGPKNSVIGMERKTIIQRFVTGMPQRFEVARGAVQMDAVLIDVDEQTGKARGIQRVRRVVDPATGDRIEN